MTDERNDNRWRELGWRRNLAPAQQEQLRTWLAAHPEAKADLELETGLTEVLARLPNAPVASNFTARVLDAVERDAAVQAHHRGLGWFVRPRRLRWLPKLAFAGVLAGAGLISYHQVLAAQRAAMAQSVATVSAVTSLPKPELLKDFEGIRALEQTGPDVELLRLLR